MNEIAPEQIESEVMAAGKGILAVLYLWGHQCPNCEVFARHFPKLRAELETLPLRWFKLNVYDHPDVGTRFGIHGIPTFLLFREGKLLGRMTSFQGDEYFSGVIREQCGG